MALGMVRAGRPGEYEPVAPEKGLAMIGWEEAPDLSIVKSRSNLHAILKKTYPDYKPQTLLRAASQILLFWKHVQNDDRIALPLKSRSAIALGRVTGPYQYRRELPLGLQHVRPVNWKKKRFPEASLTGSSSTPLVPL